MAGDFRASLSAPVLDSLRQSALRFADACSSNILELVSAGLDVSQKSDSSFVTNADRETERMLRELVAKEYPEHGVMGEEFGATNESSEFQWIVDPIDGTEEFVNGLPYYGMILGLHFQGQPIVGIIDHPGLQTRLEATFGRGCLRNNKRVRIAAQSPKAQSAARAGIGSLNNFFKYTDESDRFIAACKAFPNMRAFRCCYSHTLTASGGLDLSLEWNVSAWDLASTELLVTEAGGKYKRLHRSVANQDQANFCAVFGERTQVDRMLNALGEEAS